MSWVDILGYTASATVLATFCMGTMVPLRIIALVSNVLFMGYGYLDHLIPVFVLHATLLPVNALRLHQLQRLLGEMNRSSGKTPFIDSLLPHMTRRVLAAGETLIRKGDKADALYYLAQGELEIVDYDKLLKPGALVGEIGVFGPEMQRTATVICRSECILFELTEAKAKQLYFEDRSFGFAMLQLIIARLTENNERLAQTKTA